MKIGFSSFTLINQRQDKPQFLASTRVEPQKREPIAAPAEDDPFTKRLKKQREALESLASLPTPKEASQQQATQKVGFLRQRIEMLKAMMAFASPEQLKNMAKELKSIARELAGAAKLLNSQGGGGGAGITAIPSVVSTPAVSSNAAAPTAEPSTAAQPAVAQANGAESVAAQAGGDESTQATVSSDAQQAEASAQTAEEEAEKAAEQEAEKAAGEPEGDESTELGLLPSLPSLIQNEDNRSKNSGPSASEHALRGVLTDAQKELREAVNELKIRLREEDKEARRELRKAEEAMEKTDQAIASSTSEALYSSLGQLLPTSLSEVSVSTVSINIEV
ncbi:MULTISPECIES: hypothetical protein [unclassified Halomonas]|uniref:hypothetical protein n=1 Tax=unclassified Halomonas TaxID=2609666 RepID=UPI0007D9B31E|nr:MULTISPECIES: hypothetical protein [unclassified Halomonas]MBT2787796.1 hypothetical protein [Halomonas sp. ISL-106]MBT2799593.1 hypothetical protein [Halomonas sp. ISL-104]OAL61445.1 hypothetical protein A6R74_14635 [Halomonas sp. ALS9]